MASRGGLAFDARSESFGYQVNLLARLMAQLLQERIAPLGVAPGQFAQLLALYDADGQTAGELARNIGIEPATMTRTLQRMERDGLVERRTDPLDRRASRIHLTARAVELELPLKAAAVDANKAVLSGLSKASRADMLNAVTTCIGLAHAALDA